MKFKEILDDIINEEKTFNDYNFDGYIFYLKNGLDGQNPHIHYKNANGIFGCVALEYCGYFNHSEGMRPLPGKAEKKLLHLLNTTKFWEEASYVWLGNNPTNPVRAIIGKDKKPINPYTGKKVMENFKKPPARLSENYIEIK